MRLRITLVMILSIFLLSSCAKKETVKQPVAEAGPPAQEEPFRLPEVPGPEPKAQPVIEEKKPGLEAVLVEHDDEGKYILLNFENTDIKTIIATFSELLDINYILTPGVSGTVTIQSYRKFPVKNLFHIFQSILEINGLTAIPEGSFYRIVPVDTAKQQAVDIEEGKEIRYRLDSSFITQLVPLAYVKATDIANILRNLMPRGTDIIIYEPTNMLIVTSMPKTLLKFMKIVEALDIPDAEAETIKTFVYYVENGEAKKLADILKSIYTGKSPTTTTAPQTTVRPTPTARIRTTAPAAQQSLAGDIGEVSITAYEDINALIVKSTPKDYLSLLDILKKIDLPPKQVLIDVVIAEVRLSDSLEFGLEWLIKTGSGDTVGFTTSVVSEPPVITTGQPSGFAAVVSGSMSADLFNYVFTTLAKKTDVNVLASPHILAMDNQEAEIQIGSEVPTATSATTSVEGISTTQQIQYRSVGTILTVTPHITEKGNVSMKLVVESSSVSASTTQIGTGFFPRFETRRATTSAVIQDSHSLFLGGLISHSKDKSRTGIPILSKIPLLGYLFSSTTSSKEKTELLVIVTPHVISSQEEADVLTRDFQNRVKTIKEGIEKAFPDKDSEASAKKEEGSPVKAAE